MIKKITIILIAVLILTSCDRLLSFFISPGYYIPVIRAGWTVDMANNRIVGDPAYFINNDPNYSDSEWSLDWNLTNADTLLFPGYGSGDPGLDIIGLPFEIMNYNMIRSPLSYLGLLFKDDMASVGVNIVTGGVLAAETFNLGWDNTTQTDVSVNYTRTITSTLVSSYTLPEPAYLGIDGSGATTVLTGGLNILDFNITSDHDFVSGHASCVFSNSNPAGLLYIIYYHDSGLVSVIYAHNVETTETGNYFPDGYYEYIWSVYRP